MDQKSSILLIICRPQGEWDRVDELMMIKFGESGHPEEHSTAKEVESYQYTSALMKERLKLFDTIISVNLQEHSCIIQISSIIVARRPVYVRLALWFLHHPAWVKGHTGGFPVDTHSTPVPRSTGEAVGGLSNFTSPIHHRNTRNPHMAAEQSSGPRPRNQPASQPESRRRDRQLHSC